jgi:glutamate carboxypeptidase
MPARGDTSALVEELIAMQPAMLDALIELVHVDSPTNDPPVLANAARDVAQRGAELLGRPPEMIEVDGIWHLRWGAPRPSVLLLGHYDTVWPAGTPAARPPQVDGDHLAGPGSFDMKAGIVQAWFALRSLQLPPQVTLLLTGDEERGAPTSADLIADHAAEAQAVLVIEPSEAGALKTARFGVKLYRLTVDGRSAHAGLDSQVGVNAFLELARQVVALTEAVADRDGVLLTPSNARAGHGANVVPALATCTLDVRARTRAALDDVGALVADLRPHDGRARVRADVVAGCPPLEGRASEKLFGLAQQVAADLGLGALRGAEVGGASDGNRTAALGIPTLDGLGAVGGGAHADNEHVVIDELPRRAALLAGLLNALAS